MESLRHPAVKFRRKVYVAGPRHKDAIDLAFKEMSKLSLRRTYDRISAGKETIIFGYACEDGTDWVDSDQQGARLRMYGFD
jgi:hypothetical protein